jgi:hypothetical protein
VTRTALTALLTLFVLGSTAALAGDCEDDFAECQDDCLIQYGGSIRVEMKKQYDKCLKKCIKASKRCTERKLETASNNLDEGALDNAPTSDQVDALGLPTRDEKPAKDSKKPSKKAAADESAPYEDTQREEAVPKKEALSDDEVPKSSRTSLKVEDKKTTAPSEAPKDEPPKKAERAETMPSQDVVIRMTPKRDDGKSAGDDLRDDGPREAKPADEEPPRRRREKPKEPPPKKEEDHDDLRNY